MENLKKSYLESHDAELCMAIQVLEELHNGIPGKIWDDETIREAINRFVIENGRPPKVKELDTEKYLPPHPVVQVQYGVTAGEWLRQNYPSPTYTDFRWRYADWTVDTFREVFIREYERIKPTSQVQYDLERDRNTPTTKYLIKILGVKSWASLREKCKLPNYNMKSQSTSCIVCRHIEFE